MNQIFIIGAVVIALGVAYKVNNAAVETMATSNERARVSVEAEKKNATAQAARKRITADNANDVLSRFYRD